MLKSILLSQKKHFEIENRIKRRLVKQRKNTVQSYTVSFALQI